MARYRKVEVKTWKDAKFRTLTPIPPCGQGLWLWLLTGPHTTNIPGVLTGTDRVMAAELHWPVEAFRKAFGELSAKAMAMGDFDAGLTFLPKAVKPGGEGGEGGKGRNKPESPNVVRSWRDTWDELPDCRLKLHVWEHLRAFCKALGEPYLKAFGEACDKPSVNPMPNQDQEQEQEQEQSDISSHSESNQGLFADEPPGRVNGHGPKPRQRQSEPPGFVALREIYPARVGSHRWADALGHYKANLKAGHSAEVMHAGVVRYREYCTLEKIVGTRTVQQAATFLGRNQGFLDPWTRGPDPAHIELESMQKLTERRNTVEGLKEFRDPLPGETSKQYRAAQDLAWEAYQEIKPRTAPAQKQDASSARGGSGTFAQLGNILNPRRQS